MGRRTGNRRLCVSVVVLALLAPGLSAWHATDAAFTGAASTGANTWQTGSVLLTDDDQDTALFSAAGMVPGDLRTRCLTVTYGGTFPAEVRLHADTSGALAPYLNLQVTRGSFSGPSSPACDGFVPDGVLYLGTSHEPGDVYDSTLGAFPGSWAAAAQDPDGTAAGTWIPGESHVYRFTVTLLGNEAARGLTASAAFTFGAQDSQPPRLLAGQVLRTGGTMQSPDGEYHLSMQGDGNLVVYDRNGAAHWADWTFGMGSNLDVRMQPDGDAVVYKPGVGVVWHTGTAGSGADRFRLADDGRPVLEKPDGTVVWTGAADWW